MSHHFDSPESRKDSRINITDIYLFQSEKPRRVVSIMNISPLAGLPSPFTGEVQWDKFRPGTAYEFRFDTDGDARPDAVFRFLFDEDSRSWMLYHLTGEDARDPHADGSLLGSGDFGKIVELDNSMKIWTGLAGDSFFLDAIAARSFIDRALSTGEWNPEDFSKGNSTTGATNVLSIVVEWPVEIVSTKPFGFYATVSANDHGHWTQVNRCGNPNFAATFNDSPDGSLKYNSTEPASDHENFSGSVIELVSKMCSIAGSAPRPAKYGESVARWLLPDMIPFDPELPACYGFASINGRRLEDDFGTVVYTKIFNTPLKNLVLPPTDLRHEFPYVAEPRPLPSGDGVAVPSRVEE